MIITGKIQSHHIQYNQKQLFKYYLNRSRGIEIGNMIFNLPCVYDLIRPILAKKLCKAALDDKKIVIDLIDVFKGFSFSCISFAKRVSISFHYVLANSDVLEMCTN